MSPSFRLSGIVVAVAAVTSMALAVPASADQAFHTQRLPLAAVADAPLATLVADPELVNAFDAYAPRPAYRPRTKFEQRGIDAGRDIFDLVFRRRP